MTLTSPESLFNDLRDYIVQSRIIVEKGDYLELENMDKRVETLCSAVMTMTPEQSQQYLPELEALMKELNALQALFENSRKGLNEELTGVTNHKAASRAYNDSHVMVSRSIKNNATD